MENQALFELFRQGAFPNQIDPFAEEGRYFHQMHGQIIAYLLDDLVAPLFAMAYAIGRETSLQIAEKRQPDVYVQSQELMPPKTSNYSATAHALAVEEGIEVETEIPELDALFIKARETGDLVTVLELISPSNKASIKQIEAYKIRRNNLLAKQVHVVEIDLTRSNNRLIINSLAQDYPYHIMIHLHDEAARFIGMRWQDAPKSFALPLHGEGIVVDLNRVYRQAYAQTLIAWHIHNEGRYEDKYLPFPSLFTELERNQMIKALKTWKNLIQSK